MLLSRLALIIIISMTFCYRTYGQSPAIEWERTFGGARLDHAKWIQPTNDGGYIVCGYTRSSDGDVTGNHGDATQQDAWLLKLDATGKLLWQHAFGGAGDDEFTYIVQTDDGGFMAAGFTTSNDGDITHNHGKTDIWLTRLSQNGHIIWQKTYGGTEDERAYAVSDTKDGGYIIAGYTNSDNGDITVNHGSSDYWLLKVGADGTLEWQQAYGNGGSNIANSAVQTADGGYVVAGVSDCLPGDTTMRNAHAGTDCWIIKTTATGAIEWQKAYGGNLADVAKTIIQLRDGTYAFTGTTSSPDGDVIGFHGGEGSDAWACNIGTTGDLIWQRALGGTWYDGSRSIMQCRDGGLLIGGSAGSNDGDLSNEQRAFADYWLIKLNTDGSMAWGKTFGSTGENNVSAALETIGGDYIVAGDAAISDRDISSSHGGDDVWIVKLSERPVSYASGCAESRIFPNPCTSLLQVNFTRQQGAKILLTNAVGQTVFSNEQYGAYCRIEMNGMAKGVYFLGIINDDGRVCYTRITLQ